MYIIYIYISVIKNFSIKKKIFFKTIYSFDLQVELFSVQNVYSNDYNIM